MRSNKALGPMNKVSAVFVALLISAESLAADLTEESMRTIGYSSVQAALESLIKKPSVAVREQNGWTYIDDASDQAKWTFVPSGHPAYPTAAKQSVRIKDGNVWIDLKIECEADRDPCDKFAKDFRQYTEQLSGRMRKQLQQPSKP